MDACKRSCLFNFTFFLLFFVPTTLIAQKTDFQIMKEGLAVALHDTVRAEIYFQYGFNQFDVSPDSILKYTHLGNEYLNKHWFANGEALKYNNYGVYHYYSSNFDSALHYYSIYLEKSIEMDLSGNISSAYNNIGIVHTTLGNYFKAITFLNKSLEISTLRSDTLTIAHTYDNLGSAYAALGSYAKAMEYYNRSVELLRSIGRTQDFSERYKGIGNILIKIRKYDLALTYYKRALYIDSALHRSYKIAELYQLLGKTYQSLKKPTQSIEYLGKSLEIARKFGYPIIEADVLLSSGDHFQNLDRDSIALENYMAAARLYKQLNFPAGVIEAENKIAKTYYHQGKSRTVVQMLERNLKKATSLGLKEEIVVATKLLSQSHQALGKYKQALAYLDLNAQYTDSLFRASQLEELGKLEQRIKLDSLAQQNALLFRRVEKSESNLANANLQIQRTTILLVSGLLIILLLAIILVTTSKYTRERKRHIELLKQKNQEIVKLNTDLEKRVRERTTKIEEQNKLLKQYAFYNAHIIRAPLANILGFTQLIKEQNTEQDWKDLNENIYRSANELDEVVRKVADTLSQVEN